MTNSTVKIAFTTWFFMNQDKIASTYCINKDKVEMKCGGCCHLASTLSKMEAGKENPMPNRTTNLVMDEQFEWFLNYTHFAFVQSSFQLKTHHNYFVSQIINGDKQVFSPPPEV